MRALFILLSACLSLSAFSQTLVVKFYGAGNPQGLPQYWPQIVQPGTNAPAGFVLLTQAQLNTIISTNQAAYNAWESNKAAAVKAQLDANLAALVTAYSNLQWCAENFASVTNIATLRVAVKAEGDVLLKLKPVLQEMYKGE